jgi:hypothetical protein
MPTPEILRTYEEAIRRSYSRSVTREEYNDKATEEAIKKIAEYIEASGYTVEDLDDTSGCKMCKADNTVALLFDFYAFSKDNW